MIMKFTLSWLKDHLDTNKDLDTIVRYINKYRFRD